MSEAVQFLGDYCQFDIGPYVLMAVARKTHNDELTNSTEPVYREVIHNDQQATRAYHDIRVRCERRPYEWRVYVTANARDTQKTYFNFRDRMNSWSSRLVEGDHAVHGKIDNVDSGWVSELHRPQSAATSYFTFDLDGVSQHAVDEFTESLPREHRGVRETPNGYHVITEPFEYPKWESPVEYDDLDTDGQVHVAQIVGDSK